jgi:penicillin-insensitive murein endopeptidase
VLVCLAACAAFEPHPLASPGTSGGRTSDGWLVDGAPVPASGEGLRAYGDREKRFGSRRLAEIVVETAAYLAGRFAGAVLRVGDLSAECGGRIAGHHSHRSGRDVDLLFFTAEADGSPSVRARARHFISDGTAMGVSPPLFLDLERNWGLVAHLLEAYPGDVQWIFASHGVKAALLRWALENGAPLETVLRAAEVLHQPGDSGPHDDHFHVRIYCAPDERTFGCADVPPLWPWVRRTYDRLPHAPLDDAALLDLALGDL